MSKHERLGEACFSLPGRHSFQAEDIAPNNNNKNTERFTTLSSTLSPTVWSHSCERAALPLPCSNTFIFCSFVCVSTHSEECHLTPKLRRLRQKVFVFTVCFTKPGSFVKESMIGGSCPTALHLVLITSCHVCLSRRWQVLTLCFNVAQCLSFTSSWRAHRIVLSSVAVPFTQVDPTLH